MSMFFFYIFLFVVIRLIILESFLEDGFQHKQKEWKSRQDDDISFYEFIKLVLYKKKPINNFYLRIAYYFAPVVIPLIIILLLEIYTPSTWG